MLTRALEYRLHGYALVIGLAIAFLIWSAVMVYAFARDEKR
jgi:hypothetical protein